MTPRTKNLAMAGGAVALLGIIGVNVLVSPPPAAPPAVAEPPDVSAAAEPVESAAALAEGAAPSPAPGAEASTPLPGSTDRRSYAIGMHDLRGLPPDAAPGTAFELWVTWEPPLTEDPRLDRLIGDVVLERVIPGTVPEAPVTVLLSVPEDRTGDLIYADTFGRLSVVLPG